MMIITLQNRKGQRIVGEINTTEKKKVGTAIIQHGYSGTRNQAQIVKLKDIYLSLGFDVFTFDTTNSFGESDGHLRDARLGLHAEDCEDIINRAQEQEWYGGKLLISGCSMGGYGVLSYASKYDDVDLLVPISPVVSGELLHEAQKERDLDFYNKRKKEGVVTFESKSFPGQMKEQPRALMEEYLNHDILKDAHKISTPTLLIVGSEDPTCRPQDVSMLFDNIASNNKNIVLINRAGHTFRDEKHLQELESVIGNWLTDKLN